MGYSKPPGQLNLLCLLWYQKFFIAIINSTVEKLLDCVVTVDYSRVVRLYSNSGPARKVFFIKHIGSTDLPEQKYAAGHGRGRRGRAPNGLEGKALKDRENRYLFLPLFVFGGP